MAACLIEATLTACETEVLRLIAEGRSSRQTAGRLGISLKTVLTCLEKHGSHYQAPDAEPRFDTREA